MSATIKLMAIILLLEASKLKIFAAFGSAYLGTSTVEIILD
jgi:hypothetical protein